MVKGSKVWLESRTPVIAGRIVHITTRSIAVEITEPYSGIFQRLGIPYFACCFPAVRYFQSDGKITPYGTETAGWLLSELERGCRCFDAHRAELADVYKRLAAEAASKNPWIDDAEFMRRRSLLRRRLRTGAMSSVQYQQALGILRQSMGKTPMIIHFERVSALSDEVFRRYGLQISFCTVEQLATKFLA